MSHVRLLPATLAHLVALKDGPAAFGDLIGSPVPQGWPEFPESIDFTTDRLRDRPDEADWWMHFFFDGDVLIGSGGFVGPPRDGIVEIGYELAPAYRGKGLGTAAAGALVAKAGHSGAVRTVIANTLAQVNPSTGVLRSLGFTRSAEFVDPEEGPLWRWELALTAC
ncbi:GNAT family N-acetyltransferase [Mycobacterium deserti]|uniref:GNAT family N-acetyltransferase n=1 Tax=Mycobacterium deserti TaxID=2978347 RepID=A0ABT2MCR9_9MYCO|nr:GNAT family protein [Mycobacterium deserti]MCT7658920.1 GNAT family N-acetyltransferase [Mycobacterium deserti]